MPKLQTLPANAAPETILAAIERDGAVILADVLPTDLLDRIEAETRPHIKRSGKGLDEFTGRNTTRTGALVARSPAAREAVMHPLVLELAQTFLKPYCERIQLHLTQLIRILPGQGAQMLHRDRLAWGGFIKGYEPQFNTIWALTDFTEENGATQVAPGSQRWEDELAVPKPEDLTQAVMARGSVLLYTGSVIHGGGENRSQAERIGMNITYCLGWLRQEENQYLSCPPEVARTLDPALQDLLGYTMGSYALGYFSLPEPDPAFPDTVPPELALGRLPEKAITAEQLSDAAGAVASGFVAATED